MFEVEKIQNGYLLRSEVGERFFKNEKALVSGIRDFLGLKKIGRPAVEKADKPVYNGLES